MQVSAREARAFLNWYLAMGVDCALGETGVDRFAVEEAAILPKLASNAPSRENTMNGPAAATTPSVRHEVIPPDSARLAASAATLEELRQIMEAFEGCALKKTATQLVFSDGVAGAPLMLIGEAPGRDEDLQGKPFVGRSGQLLDRILAAIGRDRTNTYIANVVPWRPPSNRTPTPEELAICLPFITRQIALAAPRVIVLLGGAATSALTGSNLGIIKQRGKWQSLSVDDRDMPMLATFHPAYLLRNPPAKRLAWSDFQSIEEKIRTF